MLNPEGGGERHQEIALSFTDACPGEHPFESFLVEAVLVAAVLLLGPPQT